jgi:hypothetical protein
MIKLGARRHFFAACFCGVLALAAGSKASGQSCPEGGSPADAGAEASAPYVMPPPATCDPSNYISAPDATPLPPGPPVNMWTVPPLADSAPPPSTGDIYTMLGIKDPMVTSLEFTYSDVKAPYADAAGCQMFDALGHTALHTCLCTKCFAQMQECDALNGCRAIAKCAWDSGCDPSASITSPTSCYPLTGGGCSAPINQYGTGSVSTSIAQQLGLCGKNNGCPSQ